MLSVNNSLTHSDHHLDSEIRYLYSDILMDLETLFGDQITG